MEKTLNVIIENIENRLDNGHMTSEQAQEAKTVINNLYNEGFDCGYVLATYLNNYLDSFLTNMIKKYLRDYPILQSYYQLDDLKNEIMVKALENKIPMLEGKNLYTVLYYTMKDISRTEYNRMTKYFAKASLKKDKDGNIIVRKTHKKRTKTETYIDYDGNERIYKHVEYTMSQQHKIIKPFENYVCYKLDIDSMFNDDEKKIINLLKAGKTKKEIDQLTGKRNDRTYKRIEKKIKEYFQR
jgi:DNA polymerase III gamma/tau subunit